MRSLTVRLGLLYMGLFSTSVLLLGGVLYWISVRVPLAGVKQRVQAEASMLRAYDLPGDVQALIDALERRAAAGGSRLPYHALLTRDGTALTSNLPSWPMEVTSNWLRIKADTHQDGERFDHEALALDMLFDDGTRLVLGRDIEDIDEIEEKLLTAIFGVVTGAMVLALLGGILMSLAIGRRIATVTRTARHIMEGELGQRIPARSGGDEFDRLNITLNEMLARNEQLFESVRRVSDNVAHELRTPLARLRAGLEHLKESPDGTRARVLEDVIAEAQGLEKTFDAVLRIARIESGRHRAAFTQVDIATVLRDVAELYLPLLEERDQSLQVRVPHQLVISGDRDLLFQSVCNLLDNACKYSPPGGQVSVHASRSNGTVEISITDTGPGIPPAERQRVLERFYRVASTASAPGAGLGLSLVAAVAERHASVLAFEDASPGLTVRWTLPAG